MTAALSEPTLEEAAKKAAGNWRSFDCFAWNRQRELKDGKNWAIFYTHRRDSGHIDQSNASVFQKTLKPFMEGDAPDVVVESYSHWAVGHINGFSVRVLRNCEITEAFRAYRELKERLAEYPVPDDDDYSDREQEATIENIANVAWGLKNDYALTDGSQLKLYSFLSENNPRAVENLDDQGSCPSEEEREIAIKSLGFKRKP